MKNTLTDLNNYMFEALERINDDSLDDKELDREIKRAQAAVKIGEVVIQNAQTQLSALKYVQEYGYENDINGMLPDKGRKA